MEPIVLDETDGESYAAGPFRLRVLAQGPESPIGIVETTVPAGFPGPVPHRHAGMSDIFYVLEGVLEFDLGGERRALGPGGFVLVPPGVVHTFANPGAVPARFINMSQPAGFERYLQEVAQRVVAGDPPSPAEMAVIAARYDFEAVSEDDGSGGHGDS